MQDQVVSGIIIAIISAIVGWAVSQATTGRKITEAINAINLRIERGENDNNRTKDELAAHRTNTTSQIISTASLVEKVLLTAGSLIELVKVQNAILERRASLNIK